MPQLRYTLTINRPVMDVFRFVADFNNDPQWQKDVSSVFVSEGSMRVGAMLTENRRTRLLGWGLDLNADIIGYQPNKLIEYKGILGRFFITGSYQFESVRSTTQFTQTMNIRMGFLYGLFSPLMRAVMMGRTRRSMEALKTLLESRGPTIQ